ncbi:MAG: metallophosphoesterase family protein [Bacilli bacterium]|nr:metallophosphoesterase family protein [Bacilli bacterium]
MKIVLVSDSHGNNMALEEIALRHPNADLYLHLGDSESDSYSIYPYRSVRGNCDYFGDFLEYLVIPTPYGNLFAQHKPNVNSKLLEDNQVRIFAYGHTHQRKFLNENGLILVNPGAVTFARDGHDSSYAILDISEEKVEVTFHSLDETFLKNNNF